MAGTGRDGLVAVASHPDADLVLCASAGTDGLEAVLAAIELGKTIALANKEILVMAGGIVTEAATRRGVAILPVDSEHNAIHQCLHGRDASELKRLVLTASGGPFRGRSASDLSEVSPDDALQHPTWRMGRKITIDSATLMNKGLEVIEAHWLFGVRANQIDVVIHPQSIVHSMVELVDGSLIAQLGITDMRLPIQYAFSYPERWPAHEFRYRACGTARLRGAGHRGVPVPAPGVSGARGRTQPAGGAERRQRDRGCTVSRGTDRLYRHSAGDRGHDERAPASRGGHARGRTRGRFVGPASMPGRWPAR